MVELQNNLINAEQRLLPAGQGAEQHGEPAEGGANGFWQELEDDDFDLEFPDENATNVPLSPKNKKAAVQLKDKNGQGAEHGEDINEGEMDKSVDEERLTYKYRVGSLNFSFQE